MLRIACVIVAVLAALTVGSRADAACPIIMEGGDADASARVAQELAGFPNDGGPCVTIHAKCDAGDGAITLELHDELGGQAVRTFETPAGAAAFLVSWSRRPTSALEVHEPIAMLRTLPVAPPVRTPLETTARAPLEAAPAPGPRSTATSELSATGMISGTEMATLGFAMFRGSASRQLGIATRLVTGSSGWDSYYYYDQGAQPRLAYVGGQIEVAYRIAGPGKSIRTRLEIAGGVTSITRVAQDGNVDLLSYGLHEGMRVAASLPLAAGLFLETGLGLEVMWQTGSNSYKSPVGDADLLAYPHVELGLRWCL